MKFGSDLHENGRLDWRDKDETRDRGVSDYSDEGKLEIAKIRAELGEQR